MSSTSWPQWRVGAEVAQRPRPGDCHASVVCHLCRDGSRSRVSQDGKLTIPAVWSAIDAGTVVNRRHVEAQVEGGTLYGLSNALYGEITAKQGLSSKGTFPAGA